jgi:hypothetical protein
MAGLRGGSAPPGVSGYVPSGSVTPQLSAAQPATVTANSGVYSTLIGPPNRRAKFASKGGQVGCDAYSP